MLRDVSYRYKVPLVVMMVIAVTAIIVSGTLIFRAYGDAKRELTLSALDLSKTLSRALRPAMLHDELWQAYEVITSPLDANQVAGTPDRLITVLDNRNQVYVSSSPVAFPVLSRLGSAGPEFASLSERISVGKSLGPRVVDPPGARYLHAVFPIVADDRTRLGTVVVSLSSNLFLPQFFSALRGVLLSAAFVLAVLLPLGWYFGNRIAQPLTDLAERMPKVGREPVASLREGLPRGDDEIGVLSASFARMAEELEEKEAMKAQMLASDRLAAIGRLTAGISHEINNPLGGMLNAISTYKKHGRPDLMTAKTMSLLERGLTQIQETVAALLVEARLESHALTRQDIEDTRTLVAHDAHHKHVQVEWQNELEEPLPLPSTPVRQILLNLLLNAVEAVEPKGRLECRVSEANGSLHLCVTNDGRQMSRQQLEHLYEPFAPQAESPGGGLGLWVTYQLVQQLNGKIEARAEASRTSFDVVLPVAMEL